MILLLGMSVFHFPLQTAFYKGKVRDVYTIANKWLVMIASNRISAFDVILPEPIPYKGQVLNQVAAYMLNATKDICPNWLISNPAPNVSLGIKCEPFKIEMVVRGNLTGHAWRTYRSGERKIMRNRNAQWNERKRFFPRAHYYTFHKKRQPATMKIFQEKKLYNMALQPAKNGFNWRTMHLNFLNAEKKLQLKEV